jgi:transposase-like protein
VDTISMQYDRTLPPDTDEAPYIQHNGRREYRQAFKLGVIKETMAPGASVSVIARRYNMNTNVLFRWRAQYRQGLLGKGQPAAMTALIPVGVIGEDGRLKPNAPSADEAPPCAKPAESKLKASAASRSRVRIALSDKLSVCFDAGIEADALRRILEVARGFA